MKTKHQKEDSGGMSKGKLRKSQSLLYYTDSHVEKSNSSDNEGNGKNSKVIKEESTDVQLQSKDKNLKNMPILKLNTE
jgi:hypothetical protein